jgi:DNA-binding NarL/FixJ family response regulator|nr:MAG TPA: RNA dependent RNA polymerase [Caudoviricetes sp.]
MYQDKPPIEDVMIHYGVSVMDGAPGRGSGRYPWGSGENPKQRTDTFLSRYNEYAGQGLTEKEIAEKMGTTTTKLRVQLSYAKSQKRMQMVDQAKSLRKEGKSLNEIAEIMGFDNDSSVRSLLNENAETRMRQSTATADKLRELVKEKGFLDVGPGAERELGVSRTKFDQALYILEMEGYDTFNRRIPQATNPAQKTTLKVLTPPGTQYSEIYDASKIHSVGDYAISYDDGETFHKPFEFPSSLDSKRLMINYAEDGGIQKDGVIEIRRGVKDLDMGNLHYGQARILVDGTHYLKGMAVYADDLPDGVDVRFNTNKTKDVPMMDVLKKVKRDKDGNVDRDNPFGSLIKEKGGQSYYIGDDGKEHLSKINWRAVEGDWGEWADKLPSQFLAKQPIALINRQLKIAIEDKQAEFDEIRSLTNPTVKRKLLEDFADGCDKNAVTLQAAALPRQKYQVILPLNSISENEIYAPNFNDGETVALVRYPHGGLFEIPILKVNTKNAEGKRVIGTNPKDAVGINAKVAERLSGADFDGDTVMVIPFGKGYKIASQPELEGLKGFDPKVEYKIPAGDTKTKRMTDANTQKQMGVVSNLIMDMTLAGASTEELARAVRHSMVVIDAKKHDLDYKRSESDNGIAELKRKYQGHFDENGQYHEGSATLITRAKSEISVPKRQGSGVIDPETGKKTYKVADDLYYETSRVDKKTGEVITKQKMRTQQSTKMAETDDAYTLVSYRRTKAELAYAEYANKLKSLANEARKEMKATGTLKYSPEAKKAYEPEVTRLQSALALANSNKPRERQAQVLANARIKEKIEADPDLANDKKMLKKVSQQAIVAARQQVGAKRHPITISDKEWEAIQAGAISDNVLSQILESADIDNLRQRATPRANNELSNGKIALIKARAASGYTNAQIAESLGISASTVSKYLNA